jgi:hypothetical protein
VCATSFRWGATTETYIRLVGFRREGDDMLNRLTAVKRTQARGYLPELKWQLPEWCQPVTTRTQGAQKSIEQTLLKTNFTLLSIPCILLSSYCLKNFNAIRHTFNELKLLQSQCTFWHVSVAATPPSSGKVYLVSWNTAVIKHFILLCTRGKIHLTTIISVNLGKHWMFSGVQIIEH